MTDAPRPDLTAADWAAMRERVNAATPGPWHAAIKPHKSAVEAKKEAVSVYADGCMIYTMARDYECLADTFLRQKRDADFIAHARTDLPLALDALARQQEANARLTAENARLKEDGADHKGAEIADVHAEILHRAEHAEAALADRDAKLADCRQRLARQAITVQERQDSWQRMREERDALKALCRDTKGMATDQMVADRDATIARLREAVTAFLAKWDVAESHINSAMTIASIHHCPYGGPNLIDELKALRALTPAKEADRG